MKRIASCWLALALVAPVAGQTLLTGLVGYWNFDEGAGTTINDRSGTGNNGTLVNGGSAWTTGHFGNALSFPGTTGAGSTRVEIPNAASLQLTSAITVAAWVRVDNISSDAPIIAKEGGGGLLSYWFGTFPTGHFGMLLDQDGNQGWEADHRGEGSLTQGAWVHLAATWDGTTMINYVNGTSVSAGLTTTSLLSAINVSTARLFIGANSEYNTTAFTGLIDDLYIYNRALSVSEIGQLLASPIPEPAAAAAVLGGLMCATAIWRCTRRARLG